MTREELHKKIQFFEEEMSKIPAANPAYLMSPILALINLVQRSRRRKMKKTYEELLADLHSMESQLDPKDYMGWRRRLMAAYSG